MTEGGLSPRLSIVTLGVANVAKSRAFYEQLGWQPSSASQEQIVFFQLSGVVLALFDRQAELLLERIRTDEGEAAMAAHTVAAVLNSRPGTLGQIGRGMLVGLIAAPLALVVFVPGLWLASEFGLI